MRLIDATTLRAEFTGNFHEMWHYTGIQAMIDVAPTVDAEQVRHGRWIYKYFDSCCSACGWQNKADTVTRIRNDYPYCPHCGAKMDAEVE